ncbi:hypothetical protein E3P81_00132 [Wallemia ichthyophaga]|nr:hypothetical protein E3P97_00035 [Wallemia ichthyophaga]TIB36161.1 hypothetical protein E3P85_00133 [Wallemia ichthyophaga]TIB51405.1 hypothetical protein E3P82_00035 [Wallemia ichthyophaga]TIB54675.1 hypothetical protein E3P81_00132 [Wallemia ichthyophaga]TIB57345.1 hypothetical protein E3P80_00035 [Wallemia ichthyophaga]
MEERWIGLLLAISSSVAIGLSFIITKKGLQDSNNKSNSHVSASDKLLYLKNPIWWAGIITMVIGEIANFAAYTFAPPVLVTPLGALSVIFGAILASFLLHERLGPIGRVGCGLCVVGSLVIILHAPEEKQVETVDDILNYAIQLPFIIYSVIVAVFSVIMIFKVVPKYGKKSPLVYISICSMVGSISVMSIKGFGVALKLTLAGNNQLTHASTYLFGLVVVLCILVQMNYFNKALDTFSTNVVNPIYYVMFSTATILASFILFQGFYETPTRDIVSIVAGFLTIFAGVYLLNKSRQMDEAALVNEENVRGADPRHSISGRISSAGAGGTMLDAPYRVQSDYDQYELPNHETQALNSLPEREESDDDDAEAVDQTSATNPQNPQISQDTENVAEGGDEGKLKTLTNILKKCMSVKDIANIRLSLPASLLYPAGNLEYWNYIGRADTLVDINQHDDPLDRMLAAARFCFAKDLRFVRGGVVKPYNSVMGEHFRCSWPATVPDHNDKGEFLPSSDLVDQYDNPSTGTSGTTTPAPQGPGVAAQDSKNAHAVSRDLRNVAALNNRRSKGKISFLTEQISHHPPVSAYWYSAPDCQTEVCGVDQVSAKISGTSIKVQPGERNNGIFVNLKDREEEYHITHPTALVSEVSGPNVGDESLRMIIDYKEESWIGKPKFLVEGVIYKVSTEESKTWNKVKQVPKDQVLASVDGTWRTQIKFKKAGEDEEKLLINLENLDLTPKYVRSLDQQDDLESRKVWEPVTKAILEKDYNQATKSKQGIEQHQRDLANERKRTNEQYQSCYFQLDTPEGKPILTDVVTFGVFGAVELNRFESVSACTPISVDWRGGESGSELSIDLYEAGDGSDISWYSRVATQIAADTKHYDWNPSQSTTVDLNGKYFVYKFAQNDEPDVYSNQFEYSRCRSGNHRYGYNGKAAIAGGIFGGLAAIAVLIVIGTVVLNRRHARHERKANRDLEMRPIMQRSDTNITGMPPVYHPRSNTTSFNSSTSPPPYSAIYENLNSDSESRVSQPSKVRRKPVPSVD